MADWKALAGALNTGIPGDQIERIAPILDQLERAFAPLRASIPLGADVWTPDCLLEDASAAVDRASSKK